jgi:hypothetical protein
LQKHKLHIVSFDIPYPANYGGAIDVYYKIKSLAEAGVEIYLHCYEYGRQHTDTLNQWCKEVWYYPRKTGIAGVSIKLPYIVYSRQNERFLQRLQQIDAPILFEGVHSTYYLNEPSLKERYKIIRNHNVEHEYYQQLYQREQSFFKKTYFKYEAQLLKRYEAQLGNAQAFMPLSLADYHYFREQYPQAAHTFVAPFHPYEQVSSKIGMGGYCLYHGNLSHAENYEAALYLLREVFSKVNVPFIIAGRNPTNEVIEACKALPHSTLVANPSTDKMTELIENAHIHLLPTFQPTGMKLKLLYALYGGRHVIVNESMIHGTALENSCVVANCSEEMCNRIEELMSMPFTENDKQKRVVVLSTHYDNAANAQKILTSLPPIFP